MTGAVEVDKEILRDLGDGLVMRRATPEDADALAEFNGCIHSETVPEEPDLRVAAWTHDLLARPHPTFQPGDCILVQETRTGRIVSSMNMISQTWSYGGVCFGVGRPELVGTLPEYRRRGLVRAQFDVVHQWSAERGHLLQAITGIPYYYRLFGYEMAVNLASGRAGFRPQIPRLREGEAEPFKIRPAQEADLPFIARMYAEGSRRNLLNCERDEALWAYELHGKSPENVTRYELRVIETSGGEPVGYLAHPSELWNGLLAATSIELKPGLSWAAVAPTVVRYLEAEGEALAAASKGATRFESFGFWVHTGHPILTVLHNSLPRERKPYAWYLRVPDLPAFLRRITPVLEARLAASPVVGHTGELKITFYRGGLRFVFEGGRLALVEPWKPEPVESAGQAAFPGLTFLQLLFGYRSLEELREAFPDCDVRSDEAWALLTSLFPKQASDIWPVS